MFRHRIQDASKALGWIARQVPEESNPPSGAVAAVRMVVERLDEIREAETDPGLSNPRLPAMPCVPDSLFNAEHGQLRGQFSLSFWGSIVFQQGAQLLDHGVDRPNQTLIAWL